MTLFSASTSQSLPSLVRRHLSPHLKFSPCPCWCASSNKEFLLLCQPLPLLLCRSNSPSSSERYRPQRRRGHPDPGSPKKVTGFFLRPVVIEKKLILVSHCHRPRGRTWHSYSGEEKFDKVWTGHFWARLASFLVTQRRESRSCAWRSVHFLTSLNFAKLLALIFWYFSKLWSLIPATQPYNVPVSDMETPTYPNSVKVDISTYFTLLGWTSVELGSGDQYWNKEMKI